MNYFNFSTVQRHLMTYGSQGGGQRLTASEVALNANAKDMKCVNDDPMIKPVVDRIAISQLRNWITRQSCVRCKADDASLIKFYRNCKYDMNKAKRRIDRYYMVRLSAADWLMKSKHDISTPPMMTILRSGICVPCDYDVLGRRILICRLGCCSQRQGVSVDDVLGLITFIVKYALSDKQTTECGLVVVMDFKGFGMRDAAQYTPSLIKKIVTLVQYSIPCRLKALHLLNAPNFVPTVLKSFAGNKLKTRIHVHGPRLDLELHGFIPPECLPDEYGGNQGELQKFIEATEINILNAPEISVDNEEDILFENNEDATLI